ncbi:MAG: CDP-diacylglycerol--serine O-phosphatidyltransferase [Planctomycetes bacterium]|nr:CDP-diacylglycerol--serine O-phosphatidyltransferase [Planctomycetota bacterium]
MKKVAIIPTLLTLGNAVCGFAAIACASKIDLEKPATEYYFALGGWLVIGAMVFDALDGYVARLSRVASKFGGELDSLCDAISFGVAPAFLLLRMGPGWEPQPLFHQILAGIATLYMVCAILRLARFNVENTPDPASHKRFRGLPSPGAAGCLASLAIVRGEMATRWPNLHPEVLHAGIMVWSTLGALAVALLMVSRVPYPHVTKQILRGRHHFRHLIQVLVIVFFIITFRDLALVLIFWIYGLGIPLRYTLLRSLRRDPFPAAPRPGMEDVLPR